MQLVSALWVGHSPVVHHSSVTALLVLPSVAPISMLLLLNAQFHVLGLHAVRLAGCSGGGTQTAFLSSIDPRIGPAVVACYSSTFERQWQAGGVSTQYQHFKSGV